MCLLVAKRLRKELPNLTDCSNDSTSHTVKFFVLILAKLIRNIPWTEPVCNMEVSKKMAPERTLILRIKKTAYIPLTHNGGSKNLSRTVHIEGKRDRGSERVTWGACVNTWWKRGRGLSKGKNAKTHTRQKVVKSHYRLCAEGIWHIVMVI